METTTEEEDEESFPLALGLRKQGFDREEEDDKKKNKKKKVSEDKSEDEMENQRQSRLKKMREYETQRRSAETKVERERRLRKMRAYVARKLAKESCESRQERLLQYRLYQARRLMSETQEQREQRLLKGREYLRRYKKSNKDVQKHKTKSSKSSRKSSGVPKTTRHDTLDDEDSTPEVTPKGGIATSSRQRASKTKAYKAIKISCKNPRMSGAETSSSSESEEATERTRSSGRRNQKEESLSKRIKRRKRSRRDSNSTEESDSDLETSLSLNEESDDAERDTNARPNTRAKTKASHSSVEPYPELGPRISKRKATVAEESRPNAKEKRGSSLSRDESAVTETDSKRETEMADEKVTRKKRRGRRSLKEIASDARTRLESDGEESDVKEGRGTNTEEVGSVPTEGATPSVTEIALDFETNGVDKRRAKTRAPIRPRSRKERDKGTRTSESDGASEKDEEGELSEARVSDHSEESNSEVVPTNVDDTEANKDRSLPEKLDTEVESRTLLSDDAGSSDEEQQSTAASRGSGLTDTVEGEDGTDVVSCGESNSRLDAEANSE